MRSGDGETRTDAAEEEKKTMLEAAAADQSERRQIMPWVEGPSRPKIVS